MARIRGIWVVSISVLLVCGIIGVMVYNSMFVNLFGFQIKKSQIQRIIVYSPNHAYYVQNPKFIEQIYNLTSALQQSQKIGTANFPKYQVYSQIPKFLVQTKDDATYGGSIWADGHLVDANGYYWTVTPQLLRILEQSIKDTQSKKIF